MACISVLVLTLAILAVGWAVWWFEGGDDEQ
jgi:hypothetical protein